MDKPAPRAVNRASGERRPLGRPALEQLFVQRERAVVMLLSARVLPRGLELPASHTRQWDRNGRHRFERELGARAPQAKASKGC